MHKIETKYNTFTHNQWFFLREIESGRAEFYREKVEYEENQK